MEFQWNPRGGSSLHCLGRIGIWKCWLLRREENRITRRKTLGAGTRTNNKLNPHMTPSSGIELGPHWWEASWETNAQPLRHPGEALS